MPYDEKLVERVRRALAGKRGIVEKKMMGSICFMVGGTMCCGVKDSSVLIRVGREGYAAALDEPHVRPLEFAGRRPSGFVLVDAPAHTSDKALAGWIARGLAVVATLPKKKPVAKKRAATKKLNRKRSARK